MAGADGTERSGWLILVRSIACCMAMVRQGLFDGEGWLWVGVYLLREARWVGGRWR